jgi:hypothetical protein
VKEDAMKDARRITRTIVVSGIWLGAAGWAQAQKNPCELLTAAELEAALGGKAALSGSNVGAAQICSGVVGSKKVMIRVGQRAAGEGGEKERKGIEKAKEMGIQVQVETEGDLTCSTMIPPETMQQMGYNTTCTILRSGVVVGVEVTATTRKDMASTQSVKGLVQKARSRM